MSNGSMTAIAGYYTTTHERILQAVESLSQAELDWTAGPKAPSIAFHLWHAARYADYVAEIIWGPGSQIWEQERLSDLWGLSGALGYAGTGMGLDDAVSTTLPLPGKDTLVEYARRAFMHGNAAVQSLTDEQFNEVRQDRYGTVWKEHILGSAMLNFLAHTNRHLGMIEALKGFQGMRGTATR
jgi:hypothetical protein